MDTKCTVHSTQTQVASKQTYFVAAMKLKTNAAQEKI